MVAAQLTLIQRDSLKVFRALPITRASAQTRRRRGATDPEALRHLLQRGRAAIDPASLGFVRGDPRGLKSPGLTQAHMDQLLSTDPDIARTPGTYGRLERGILDNPAPEYLRGVGRILRFTSRGWESLYSFARGEMPPFPLWDEAEIEFEPLLHHVSSDALAFICDFAGNVLTFNMAFAQVFPNQRVPMNWYHYVLFDEYARTVLCPDWSETWGPRTVTALRGARAQHRHNNLLQALAQRCGQDPATRSLFATIGPSPDVDERVLVHNALGPGIVQLGEPLRSPGAHISQYNWHFRAAGGPQVRLTAIELRGEKDLDGFFPSLGLEDDAIGLTVLDG